MGETYKQPANLHLENLDLGDMLSKRSEEIKRTGLGTTMTSSTVGSTDLYKTFDKIKKYTGRELTHLSNQDVVAQNYGLALYKEAKQKSQDQGFFGEFAGFVAQSAGEIALGAVDGAAQLLDVQAWGSHMMGGTADWGNWLSDYTEKGKEAIRNVAPIYEDPDNKNRTTFENMMSGDGYWAANGVSLASSLSIMLPVLGWARGLSLAGKGMKFLGASARLGKYGGKAVKAMSTVDRVMDKMPPMSETTKLIFDGVHKGLVSRNIEASMEATAVFRDRYKAYTDSGMTDEASKKAAGKAAAFSYNANWAFALTDIPQYLMMGASGRSLSKMISKSKPGWVTNSKLLSRTKGIRSLMTVGALEGGEEYGQFVVSKEGARVGDIQAGIIKEDDITFGERLAKYNEDSEAWTSALFGALGGTVFQKAGPKAEMLANKIFRKGEARITVEDVRREEEKSRFARLSSNVDVLNQASKNGNEEAIHAAKTNLAFEMAREASKANNWDKARANILQMKQATPEERAEQGLDDNFDDFIKNIDQWVDHMDYAVDLVSEANHRYTYGLADQIAKRQFDLHMYNHNLASINSKIEDEIQNVIPNYNHLSKTGRDAVDTMVHIEGKIKSIQALRKLAESKEYTPAERESFIRQANMSEEMNKDYQDRLSQILNTPGAVSHIDSLALKSIEAGAADNLITLSAKKHMLHEHNVQVTGELNTLTSREYIRNFKADREKYFREFKEKERKDKAKAKSKKPEPTSSPTTSTDQATTTTDEQVSEPTGDGSVFDINNLTNAGLAEVVKGINSGMATINDYAKNQEELDKLEAALADYELMHTENPSVFKEEQEEEAFADEDKGGVTETANEEDTTEVEPIPEIDDADDADINEEENDLAEAESVADHDYIEIPGNPDDFTFYRVSDDDTLNAGLATTDNQLAWLSVNNPESKLEPTEANKALSSFLESSTNSLDGVTVDFEIDHDFISEFEKTNPGSTKYSDMVRSIIDGVMPSNDVIGYMPVKAKLMKNGSQIEHDKQLLSMSLHDPDFFFNRDGSPKYPVVSESMALAVISQKTAVVDAVLNNKKISSKITFKSSGKLNQDIDEDGKVKKKDILTTLKKSLSRIEFVVGNKNGRYVNSAKQIRMAKYKSATPGAIYTKVTTANGIPVPLRLQVSNVSENEANLLHTMYVDILTNPELISGPLSEGIVEYISLSTHPEIKGLLSLFPNIDTISYGELLDSMVYQGRVTEKSDAARLVYYVNTEFKGKKIPNSLKFGMSNMTADRLDSGEGQQEFINWISNNKRRQVDLTKLADNDYKEFLISNKILSTNLLASEEGNVFVQPVIGFGDIIKSEGVKESEVKEEVILEVPKTVVDIKSVMSTINMFQTGIKTSENKEIKVNLPKEEDFEKTPCKK